MSRIYVVGNDYGVTRWLQSRKHDVTTIQNPVEAAEALPDPELVVFTGGEDVWPVLYGERNEASGCNPRRDITEMIWFHRFLRVPKLGICRGGQFLNVMSGGKMVQDRLYHALGSSNFHLCRDFTSESFWRVTSTHHQEMVAGLNGLVLAVGHDMPDGLASVEVVQYTSTNSVCFQPHPEYAVGDPQNQTVVLLERVMAYTFGKGLKI